MSILLKKGVSPDLADKKGKTALHYSGSHFVDAFIRLMSQDSLDHFLMMIFAAFAGQLEILQTLIAHNADTEKRDFV